jgi:hypothetical protein
MERMRIKERVKGWRGWREYMGLLREQNAMVTIFMHKKRIHDTRLNIMAWKDQLRCEYWLSSYETAAESVTGLALRCGSKCSEQSASRFSRRVGASFGKT